MDSAPHEILEIIAAHLAFNDLLNSRLISKRFSSISKRLVYRHIYVLNTSRHISKLAKFLEAEEATTCTHLTVYHAQWPVCNRQEWELHPLQFYDLYPQPSHRTGERERAEGYRNYFQFMAEERSRNTIQDIAMLKNLLTQLPRLRTLTISTLQSRGRQQKNPKFAELQREIWISPSYKGLL